MTREDVAKLLQQKQSYERNQILTHWAMTHGCKVIYNTPMWEVETFIEKYLKNK